MRPSTLALACALIPAFAAGCATGTDAPPLVERDSAGVEIIEYSAGALAEAPAWTTGPATLTIGTPEDADQALTQVTSAQRLSDGRILVVDFDKQAAVPVLFGADGSFERRLGRPGSGPGEFQYAITQAVLPGDTILFWDAVLRRQTRMLPSGAVVGTEGVGAIGAKVTGEPKGRLADGRLLSVPYAIADTTTGSTKFFRRPGPVILIDLSRQAVDTIATGIPGDELYVVTFAVGTGSETAPTTAPYGKNTVLIPAGDRVIVATNESSDVASYSVPWQLRRVTRFARPRRPIDAAARTAYLAHHMAEIDRTPVQIPEQREWLANFVNASQFPDSMGYYSSATMAADSTLWLSEVRSLADSLPTYVVIGADGLLKARMTLPAGSRLLWAGRDDLLLGLRDQDDVERIELRPILRP